MKKYNFIRFEGDYPRGDIKISINRPGLLRLSSAFCKTTNITDFEYITLYYDESNNAIGLHPTNEFEKGASKITKDKKASVISIKAFMRANKLIVEEHLGKYDYSKQILEGVGDVYIIELKKNETTA